jgi:CDP-diacylglycerol--glycerol-3-phosphate 3-phosphatidyltransferase
MANRITLVRIVSLPLLLLFLTFHGKPWAILALFTFVLLSLTDILDGWVARKYGQVTRTGKLLDPIADKLLIMTALLPLIQRGSVAAWVGVVILGRELIVTGVRMIAAAEHLVIAAGTLGKYKTILYIVGISILIGAPGLPYPGGFEYVEEWLRLLGLGVLAAGIAFGIVSGVEYYLAYSRAEGDPPADTR